MGVRLIDANALKEYIKKVEDYESAYTICGYIDNAPTVEYPFYAEAYQTGYEEGKNDRPQGEWGKHGECPFCSYIRQWEDDKFCGNCGAAMRGDT